ncbi:purine-nucleoside phosphorylase [candidate division KSB1 bacterium]|nr:purine-nucleoside phosphorylase [candidate division KSB1 bacterium]
MNVHDQINESIKFIWKKTRLRPNIGIILGSGLGSFSDTIDVDTIIKTSDIPHYPVSTVPGHEGALYFGELNSEKIIAVKGRVHYYEGYPMQKVAYCVNLMAALGVRYLIVTNAAGGVNCSFVPGDLMVITDHIGFYFDNPLIGVKIDDESKRFVNMYPAYDPELIKISLNTATRIGINLKSGVLFASTGPCYETAAEVAMIKKLGGDAVTMSTVPEVIVANQNHIRVLGISCITNMSTGISDQKLDHDEVTATADKIKGKFMRLVHAIIVRIGQLDH